MAIDLVAIRKRALDFFGLYHPTAGPCRCGSCNPVAHSGHPLHEAMGEVRQDHNALLAEVERLAKFEKVIRDLEELHGGVDHEKKCSAVGDCMIGDVMVVVRKRLEE